MTSDERYEIWITLNRTVDAMSRLRQKETRPQGLTVEQSAILSLLRTRKGNPTPAEISRWIFRKPSSVTVALNRMVAKGLVQKAPDPKRKNWIRVSMTEKGKELSDRMGRTRCVDEVLSRLSDEQCEQLQAYLQILLTEADGQLRR